MTKEFTLHAGTVSLIKELLSLGGWANEIVDIYNAGKLIEVLPEPDSRNIEDLKKPVTVQLTSKQFDTICKTVKFHVSKGVILPTVYATQLIEQFELFKE